MTLTLQLKNSTESIVMMTWKFPMMKWRLILVMKCTMTTLPTSLTRLIKIRGDLSKHKSLTTTSQKKCWNIRSKRPTFSENVWVFSGSDHCCNLIKVTPTGNLSSNDSNTTSCTTFINRLILYSIIKCIRTKQPDGRPDLQISIGESISSRKKWTGNVFLTIF